MKQRIITGLVAGIGLVVMLYMGGLWFAGLILLLAWIGFNEFLRMNGLQSMQGTALIGYIGVTLLAVPWNQLGITWLPAMGGLIWIALFLLLCVTVISKNKVTIDHIAMVFAGMVYVGVGFHYMIATRWIDEGGFFWTLLVFICIWASDSGAYFTGTMIGRTPLWPSISPNKSVEGAIGGVAVSMLAALCFSFYSPDRLTWTEAAALGLAIAVVGQMGDLIQSAYKRVKGIKDTGTLLPGHGGVLDRTDSWLIVFPFVHLFSLIPHV